MERRRREGRTDYVARLAMLKSGKPRLVIRKTSRHINASLIDFDLKGDKVLANCSSSELGGFGWKGSMKNTSAAYLTGLLLSRKAGGVEAIVDIGLQTSTKGNRLYAVSKGALDGGLKVNIGDLIPSEDRIKGKHIADYAKSLGDGERSKIFSGYRKSGADPREMDKMFEEVKTKIMSSEKDHTKKAKENKPSKKKSD